MERSASEPVRRLRIRRRNDLNVGLPGFTPSFVLNTDFENTIRGFREDRDLVKGAMDELESMSEKGYVNLSEIVLTTQFVNKTVSVTRVTVHEVRV